MSHLPAARWRDRASQWAALTVLGRIGDQAGGRRAMWIDELVFEGHRVSVLGPDAEPQDRP